MIHLKDRYKWGQLYIGWKFRPPFQHCINLSKLFRWVLSLYFLHIARFKRIIWIYYNIEYCKRPLSKEKRMMTLLINERDRVVWNSSVKWMAVVKVLSYNNHISHSIEIFQFRTIFILYCFYTLIIISSYYSILQHYSINIFCD